MKNTAQKKHRYSKSTAITVLLVILLIAFCIAAYVSTDMVTNRFNAESLDIELLEEQYDRLTAEQRSSVIPNRELPKDPKIRNTDKTDAFVFLRITVPVGRVTDVEPDGTKTERQRQELFCIKSLLSPETDENGNSFNTNSSDNEYWIELTDHEQGTDLSGDERTYVFGYSVYLKSGELTETLFDSVRLKNIIQYEADPDKLLDIYVQAYGIQADYMGDISKNDGSEKSVMTAEQLSALYSYVDTSGE